MECQRCKVPLKEGDPYDIHGKILCEDCYIFETNPPKGCDPLAVSSALSIRKQLGQSGISGLTELQQKIYKTIEENGKITKEELAKTLNIKPDQLEQEFAFFRHCELIRAFREESKVYFTKWENENEIKET
jgi:hypothetical protein